jgi:hypothetical protein
VRARAEADRRRARNARVAGLASIGAASPNAGASGTFRGKVSGLIRTWATGVEVETYGGRSNADRLGSD